MVSKLSYFRPTLTGLKEHGVVSSSPPWSGQLSVLSVAFIHPRNFRAHHAPGIVLGASWVEGRTWEPLALWWIQGRQL